mmetsp:Transcript_61070/g.132392  ORF Transcript_61070/g.132392 Transcript_61070/m.132392 type:complete len:241 (-) Transcript_61070:61-783(-)
MSPPVFWTLLVALPVLEAQGAYRCTNDCEFARNGECDDWGDRCLFGTDCADCGSRYIRDNECEWIDDDVDDFRAKILVASSIGVVIGTILIFIVSMPLCCGLLRPRGKTIATAAIALGIFTCFIPFIGSVSACGPVADDHCKTCRYGCTEQDKADITTACNAIGTWVVYMGSGGVLSVILGCTAAGLACCVCCGCCNAKELPKMDQQGTYGARMVVGMPVAPGAVPEAQNPTAVAVATKG